MLLGTSLDCAGTGLPWLPPQEGLPVRGSTRSTSAFSLTLALEARPVVSPRALLRLLALVSQVCSWL